MKLKTSWFRLIKKEEREREEEIGLGSPNHSPIFGTPFSPNLNSISVLVHLGHGSVRS